MSDESLKKFHVSGLSLFFMFLARSIGFPFVDIFLKVMNRSRVIGRENIPAQGGVMLASNHVSGVDTLLIPAFAVNRRSTRPFFAPGKAELFRIPVVGTIIRLWGSFPVKRGARDFESMKRIAHYVANYLVMIFPEGTRTKTGELLKGRAGVGWIVRMARPVVIPTLMINTDKYFWPGRPRPWFGIPYTVVFGAPLDLEKFYAMPDSRETSRAIVNEIMKAIATLKERHKDLYM